MRKLICIVGCLLLLASCVDNSTPIYPSEMMEQELFNEVLTEFYIIEAVNNHNISVDKIVDGEIYEYYDQVFTKHGVTRDEFLASLEWHKANPEALNEAYAQVLLNLEARRDAI